MADLHHLDLLKQGVEKWNQWRRELPGIRPDLSRAFLSGARLNMVDLRGADLRGAFLSETQLSKAFLSKADLRGADLQRAYLSKANLSEAQLSEASLVGSDLSWVDLSRADLSGANFSGADLSGANLSGANPNGIDLNQAVVGWTIFGDIDLSMVKGLATVKHLGPSTMGIDTIYRSRGDIPEAFLRDVGIPDSFLTAMRSLVDLPIKYYTCFISYSSKDHAFAERLHTDLQRKGVRCWFAPEDMKMGEKIRERIDESIRLYDKLLLVLSQHSVASPWVEQEVETALAKERKENRMILFPIRLDNKVMEIETGWPALIRNTRTIGDFARWKQHDSYQKAFERLLRDLKMMEG